MKRRAEMFARYLTFAALGFGTFTALASGPDIGYLYPAGGKQGTTVKVIAGGQILRKPQEALVTGKGVKAKIIKYFHPRRNIYREQRDLMRKKIMEVKNKRLKELGLPPSRDKAPKLNYEIDQYRWKMPDHPLAMDFDNKSLRELYHFRTVFFNYKWRKQYNRQLSEMVLLEVTIAPDAAPGDREIRIKTNRGISNPVVFQVGTLPEVRELEPNDRMAYPKIPRLPKQPPKDKPLSLPVVINGQIMPGDVDRFKFKAKKGQNLVIQAQARSLIPYLADAVPGWFQAVVSVYDSKGKEVAFADDFRFNPDPVMLFKVPADGEYDIVVRDSIYRGRQDFVYRLSIGEQPFITQIFPLGGKAGSKTIVKASGWNLKNHKIKLDTSPDGKQIRETSMKSGKQVTNFIPYAVDDLPECTENEPNNDSANAQKVVLPKIVNGKINRPGDVDVYQFQGKAGEQVVAEVYGRKLNSPVDSLVKLLDDSGNAIKWNDDYQERDKKYLHKDITGLVTHHADSYLIAKLPKTGTYYVSICDTSGKGGNAYAYRLRISPPQTDFALRLAPSNMSYRTRGMINRMCIYALRKDGFEGEIKIRLKEPSYGYIIDGGIIPAGKNYACMTLKSPQEKIKKPVALHFEGYATVNGRKVIKPVIPADDTMQAFLYRHLVPTEEFMVALPNTRWAYPTIKVVNKEPLEIPAGGVAKLWITAAHSDSTLNDIELDVKEPAKGISIEKITPVPHGLTLILKADDKLETGKLQNLLVEIQRKYIPKNKQGKYLKNKKRKYSMGYLPAIPFKVVKKTE